MKNIKLRILVVDDIQSVRILVGQFLKKYQDELMFEEAESFREALEQAKKLKPDIVLTDMSLSDGSGVELARRVKEILPKTAVYLFSAYEVDEIRELHTLKSPADGFIQKSNLKLELHEMIMKELNRKMDQ
jgi:DNA-binding NarL/FixJ family response regulator